MMKSSYLKILFSLILIVGFFLSFQFYYISADAPYYLSVARDISRGLVPYKDINIGYTPLVMYLNSIVYLIFDNSRYIFYLIFQYCIILLSSAVLFIICIRFLGSKRSKAFLISIFYTLAVLSCDGNKINLEVYSVLCVFLGIYFYYSRAFILTGFFLGLSFFCKQYGLLNFIPFFILLIKNRTFKSTLKLSAGGVLPLFIFLLYFLLIKDLDFLKLFNQISGRDYVNYSIAITTLPKFFVGGKIFLILILPLIFTVITQRKKVDEKKLLLVLGVAINLLPVLLRSFQHYFLNTFPFLFILIALCLKHDSGKLLVQYYFIVVLIAGLWFARLYRYRFEFDNQKGIANQVEEIFPKGSEVFLFGKIRHLYLLNNYKNPLLRTEGYSYPFKPGENQIDKINIVSNSIIGNQKPDIVIQGETNKIYVYLTDREN